MQARGGCSQGGRGLSISMLKNLKRSGSRLRQVLVVGCVAGFFGAITSAKAETATFHFAPLGGSFSAALLGDDPLIGGEITATRIYLDVEAFPGSDAADFFTDISFPIEPSPGNTNALVLVGADLGWSGAGTFHYFETTSRFNGVFAPYRYGGETPAENFDGLLLDTSRIEFDYIPASGGEFALTGAALRKRQGSAGDFEVALPLSGEPAIESRGSGESRVVFTFNRNVTGAGSANATCGKVGTIKVDPADPHSLVVKFDAAGCDQSVVAVTLNDVMDDAGGTLATASVSFGILFGDVTADGTVDRDDRAALRAVLDQPVNSANFRADLNADGQIDRRDLERLQRFHGSHLP